MKKGKKVLSFLLALSMVLSLNVNLYAAEPNVDLTEQTKEETVVTQTEETTELGDVEEAEQEAGVSKVEGKAEKKKETKKEAQTLEAGIEAYAMGTKPADGTTSGQPFSGGTGGSSNFRIPAMVTLKNGTIVAATDARWNTTADGGGLDTIVSRSTDNGVNWNYTFANYLGDNGNVANKASTAFIDPALATDGTTVYMVVDLFPAGYALNGATNQPIAGQNGFDQDGYLRLSSDNRKTYGYYLKDGRIYTSNGKIQSGYTVDEYFNIKANTVDTNLFCADSPYKVYPTNYLYLTKSTDGGKTWGTPTLINVKKEKEQTCLVGPGNGIVTSSGRILFTCYNYTSGDKNSSVIYSDDEGKSWTRSADMSDVSSEATVTEADGKLYMFTRHGGYYVSTDDGTTWSARKNVAGITYDTGCQMNAIRYSEKIDGKTAILLSAPSGTRTNGRIFVGLVQDDNSISWDYTYNVNSSAYAYSCMSELSDGSVGLLYENGTGSEKFVKLSIEDIASGAKIGDAEVEPGFVFEGNYITELSLEAGSTTKTVVFKGLSGNQAITVQSSDEDVVKVVGDGDKLKITPTKAGNAIITVNVSGVAREIENGAVYELPVMVEAKKVDVTMLVGEEETFNVGTDVISGNTKPGVANISIVPSNAKYVKVDQIESGEQYLLVNAEQYILTPNAGYNQGYTANGLQCEGNYSTDAEYNEDLWTVTEVSGGVTISNAQGRYLNISSMQENWAAHVELSDTPVVLKKTQIGEEFLFSKSSERGGSSYDAYLYRFTDTFVMAWPTGATSDNDKWNLYATNEGYTMTITGKTAGKTTVVVGDTTYNINVREETVNDYPVISKTGNNDYSLGKEVEHLILTKGVEYQLSVPKASKVNWASENDAVATVDGNGTITATGVGETKITAEIFDGNGKNLGLKEIYITVIKDEPMAAGNNTRLVEIYVNELVDSNLFYYQNREKNSDGSLKFVQVKENTVIYMNTQALWTMTFFGAPKDDNYALTYMSAANNMNQTNWFPIEDGRAPENTSFFQNKGSLTTTSKYTDSELQEMLTASKKQETPCDGGFWFTRTSTATNTCQAVISVVSEKLPDLEKNIVSVTHDGKTSLYTEGMPIYAGDVINYEIKVTRYPSKYGIGYSAAELTETLAPFVDGVKKKNITNDLIKGGSQSSNGYIFTEKNENIYTASYTVQKEDISSELINTVNLEYNYNAAYSTGTMDATANAEARVVVLPFTPHSYVVDFGLPVTFDFSTQIQEANGNIEFESVSSKNGADVSIIEGTQSIKYELNKTMAGPDEVTIQLKGTTGSISFYVIPATTVYYEEGFADFSLWNQESVGSKGTDEQTASYFGQSERYGYDEKYSREAVGPSNGTEAVSTAAGDKADFMFTGTGVEIYANCTNETGLATIQIIDENGRTIRLLQVDTKTDNGSSDATVGQDTESYNLPIASVKGLDHGKYKVRVTHSMRGVGNVGGNLRLDGWRVFGTADNTPAVHDDVYVKDGEANPTFFELRNQVLAGLNVNITGSIYEEAGSILNQVYDSIGTKTGAIIIGNATDYDVQDLLDNGPKNELFLRPGETVTFALSDEVTSAQVGLKAVNAAVNYTMNGQAIDLTSSTDMFYDIDLKSGKNVTITNNNGGILSITKIKAFGVSGSDNIFADVQQEAIVSALLSLGFKEEVQIVHGTSKDDAVEYVQPTGKDDAYQSGEWCIYEGQYYSCKEDGTMGDPKASPQCWKKMNVNNNGKGNGNKK